MRDRTLLLVGAATCFLWLAVGGFLLLSQGAYVDLLREGRWISGSQDDAFYLDKLRWTIRALGGMGTAYLGIATLLVLALRSSWPWTFPLSRRWIFLATLLLFSVAGSVPRYLTGDEPHYLVLAESIATDLDVDVADEYLAHPEIGEHASAISADGRTYSIHNVGLGLLLALPWWIAGERGALFALAVVAAALVVVFDAWLEEQGVPSRRRIGATAGFAACLPVVSFAGQVFPDLPAAFLLTVALREMTRPGPTAGRCWIAAASLALLPWLHVRYLPIALLLAAWMTWAGNGARRTRTAISVVVGLGGSLLVLAVFHVQWFGSPWPNAMRGALAGEFAGNPAIGILGLFFDQQYGLFFVAPVYAFWLAGWVLLARRGKRSAVPVALVIATNLALAAAYPMWWGGWSVAGRFLVPAISALAFCAVAAWDAVASSRSLRWIAGGALAISLGCALVATVLPDKQFGVLGSHGRNFYVHAAEQLSGADLSSLLPRLANRESVAPLVGAALWAAAWAVLTISVCFGAGDRNRST